MNHPTEHAALQKCPFPTVLLDALKANFADRVSTAQAVREHHGRDESPFEPHSPMPSSLRAARKKCKPSSNFAPDTAC